MINPGRFKGFGENFQNMGCGWFALCGFLALFFVVPVLNYYIAQSIVEMTVFWSNLEPDLIISFLYSPLVLISFFILIFAKSNQWFSIASGFFIFSASYLGSVTIINLNESPEYAMIPAYVICGLLIFVIGNLKFWFGTKNGMENNHQ